MNDRPPAKQQEEDPVFRWIGAHPIGAGVITLLAMMCVVATIGGLVYLGSAGRL